MPEADGKCNEGTEATREGGVVWVEGLVPAIDFCNHGTLVFSIRNTYFLKNY